jgi:RNA polymerase sigma factor (sigma-70 family)
MHLVFCMRGTKSRFIVICGACWVVQRLRKAEDVFQDTWMKLVDAKDSWQARDNASFKTWLYTLAHHRAIDILRKSGREVSADEGWTEEDTESAWALWPAANAHQPEQQAFWRKAGSNCCNV